MIHMQAILGLIVFIVLAWACSEDRRAGLSLKTIGIALGLQFGLAIILTRWEAARAAISSLNGLVAALQAATRDGTALVFGYLGGGPLPFELSNPNAGFVLAFQALPLILVVSALAALLWHWRILSFIVRILAWPLRRAFALSGSLGIGCAANIFVGMVEAPLLIRPMILSMSRSDLFVLMTTGMATIAGTVLVLYATILQGVLTDPVGHIVIASVISVPAAILIARIMVPQSGAFETTGHETIPSQSEYSNTFDAITQGTQNGLTLVLNVAAMLIVLIAFVSLGNAMLGLLPDVAGSQLTFERIVGVVFQPVAWGLGLPWQESATGGMLIGKKTILNELIAFLDLAAIGGDTLSERSRIILTYGLCGFANPGSLGIMLGGFLTMAPERRDDILSLAPRSIISGTLATLMTAAIMGVIL